MSNSTLVIQKFGGSSLQTPELREQAISHIINTVDQGKNVVAVVSAMGRAPDPYATDTLINIIRENNFNCSLRELDLAVSCGEIISSAVVAVKLQKKGYPALALTGPQAGIMANGDHTNGSIVEVDSSKIQKLLENNKIVIVTGFQGETLKKDIVTLGRGGSDTTATALAGALKADRVEIYTDVDGLMTVDPKMVPKAQPIKKINFYEVLQMAKEGMKVIHPKAVEYAMKYSVPIYIKNISRSTEENGTKITGYISSNDYYTENHSITGIAHITNIARVVLDLYHDTSQNLKVEVFNALAEAEISLDMININSEQIVFTIKDDLVSKTLKVLNQRGFGNLKYEKGCTKITLIGAGMTGVPGVMAKALGLLNEQKISILQTTDSNITISCLIPGSDTQLALQTLHESFYLLQKGGK